MNPSRMVLWGTVWGCLVLGGPIVRADDAAVKALVGKLTSADESVRLAAIDQLGARGAKAAEAVAPLTELLKDSSAHGSGPRRTLVGRDRRAGETGRRRPDPNGEGSRRHGPPASGQGGAAHPSGPPGHGAAVRQTAGRFGPGSADAHPARDCRSRSQGRARADRGPEER